MTTLSWIAVGLTAWFGAVTVVLAVLTAAKRSDEALESAMAAEGRLGTSQPGEAVPVDQSLAVVHATDELFGRLAADVRGALGVERVAVVLHDQVNPDSGVVQASCGQPELVGARVPGGGGFGWGAGRDSRFLVDPTDDGQSWSVVSVPIETGAGVVGTVAVATRRPRGLSARDVELLERLSSRARFHREPPIDARNGDNPDRQRWPAA